MHSRTAVLAAMLAIAAARKGRRQRGFYPQEGRGGPGVIGTFQSETGKQVKLV